MDLKAKGKKKNTAISGTMGGMVWEHFGAMYQRRSESAFLLQRSVLERPAFRSFHFFLVLECGSHMYCLTTLLFIYVYYYIFCLGNK